MLVMRILLIFSPAADLGGGVEQNVIYSIQMFLDNQPLYTNPHYLPFSITQYTPLYYYVCGLTAKILGLDPLQHIRELYIIGRSWSIVFNLFSAAAIYFISRRIFSITQPVAYILSFASFVLVLLWDIAARPDSLHDAFALWSVYLVMLYLNTSEGAKQNAKLLIGAALLAVAAIYTKQSGIQLPVLFISFFLFIKDWRSAFLTAVVMGLAFAALLVVFTGLYHEAFLMNVIGGVDNGISLPYFKKFVMGKFLYKSELLPLALLVVYISLGKMVVFKGRLPLRFLCCCCVGMFVFATGTALKQGSSIHYYFLFLNLALVLLFYYFVNQAISVHAQASSTKKGAFASFATYGYVVYFLALLALNMLVQFRNVADFRYGNAAQIRQERDLAAAQVATFLKNNLSNNSDEYVFANLPIQETTANRSLIDNVLFRNCVIPQLDIFESSTRPSKVLGYDNIEKCLRNGTIKFIVEPNTPYHFSILQNFKELKKHNYRLDKVIGPYRIFKYDHHSLQPTQITGAAI
ncbi:ArnT family glycosyltransferase [Adhaeribacter rhizoryzae]|nr:glycosyltransferase family 39 protein [Adhaeribacter rhizoryzae]